MEWNNRRFQAGSRGRKHGAASPIAPDLYKGINELKGLAKNFVAAESSLDACKHESAGQY